MNWETLFSFAPIFAIVLLIFIASMLQKMNETLTEIYVMLSKKIEHPYQDEV